MVIHSHLLICQAENLIKPDQNRTTQTSCPDGNTMPHVSGGIQNRCFLVDQLDHDSQDPFVPEEPCPILCPIGSPVSTGCKQHN